MITPCQYSKVDLLACACSLLQLSQESQKAIEFGRRLQRLMKSFGLSVNANNDKSNDNFASKLEDPSRNTTLCRYTMSRQFTLASQVAQHVLKRDGPLTTHRLYRACLAEDAPSASTYKQPGHREWRLFGDTIVRGTTGPPNPDHLVRSVKL